MSHGVLSAMLFVTELHAYDCVIKDFYVIKRGVICAGPCICTKWYEMNSDTSHPLTYSPSEGSAFTSFFPRGNNLTYLPT